MKRLLYMIFVVAISLTLLAGCGSTSTTYQSEDDSDEYEWDYEEERREYANGYEAGAEKAYAHFKVGVDSAFEERMISESVYYDLCDAGRECIKDDALGEGYSSGYANGLDNTREELQELYWDFCRQGIISEAAALYIESCT